MLESTIITTPVTSSPSGSAGLSSTKSWSIPLLVTLLLVCFILLILLLCAAGLWKKLLRAFGYSSRSSPDNSLNGNVPRTPNENTRILIPSQTAPGGSMHVTDVSKMTTVSQVNPPFHRRSISDSGDVAGNTLKAPTLPDEPNFISLGGKSRSPPMYSRFASQAQLATMEGSRSQRASRKVSLDFTSSASASAGISAQRDQRGLLKTQRSEMPQPPSPLKNPFIFTTQATVTEHPHGLGEKGGTSFDFGGDRDPGDSGQACSTSGLDEGVDHQLGKLHFSVTYDYSKRRLGVCVKEAVGLPAMDLNGKSDPFVQLCLLPERKNKFRTRVKYRNLNPRWNESFWFEEFPLENLLSGALQLQVKDYDRFSKDDVIGDVQLCLLVLYEDEPAVDLVKTEDFWRFIKPAKPMKKNLGELLLSLCLNPNNAKLTLTILRAKNLKPMERGSDLADPYCQVSLKVPGGKTKETKKTSIKVKTIFPVWNEAFVFSVAPQHMKDIALHVKVMHKERVGSHLIGKVRLGAGSPQSNQRGRGPLSQEAIAHWNKMCSCPREVVSQWHQLMK